MRDGNHRSFVHPGGHHELDRELVRRPLSRRWIIRLAHPLHTGERNAAIAHPFVRAIVHESELLPVHHLARPRGVLSAEQGLQRSPSRRCRLDDVGLVVQAAEADRATANPAQVSAAAIGQSISSRTVCEHAEHDVSPPSSRVMSGDGRERTRVGGAPCFDDDPAPPARGEFAGSGDVVLFGPPLTGECPMNAVSCGTHGRESRVVSVLRPCVRTTTFPNAKRPTCGCAQVGRSLGEMGRRSGSNRRSRLAAGAQRCGIPPALRRVAARGDHRALAGGTIGTDGQGSHGGHARDARPRGGQPGEVTVSRPRHGRASGPRPHSSERQTRKALADGVVCELNA